jgi:serine/threonine-protein kinase RsbW
MSDARHTFRLDLQSHLDVLDYVQVVCDELCAVARLDEDAGHWVGVAVRESVINAIKHGNREDTDKQVHVEFAFVTEGGTRHLDISVRDEGEGFDPDEIADPLAPENLLKASGRGIFFMRSFMDDVSLSRRPEGGMEVRMRKQLPPAG